MLLASDGETRGAAEYSTVHRTVLTAMSYPVNSAEIECPALDGPLCIQIWICRYLL